MELSMAVGTYGFTEEFCGTHRLPDGTTLRQVVVEPIVGAYRRMIRDLEFDICELAPTAYMIARACGVGITALPIFLSRGFHYGDVVTHPDAKIEEPRDLHGKRVGVRAYTVTTGVWVRGLLADRYGVDLTKVEWVTDDEDHIRALALPPNVTPLPDGESIASAFEQGAIHAALTGAAGVGRKGSPLQQWNETDVAAGRDFHFRQMFDKPDRLAAEDFTETGIYPIHRVLAVRDTVIEQIPDVLQMLFGLFAASKNRYLRRLEDGSADTPGDEKLRRLSEIVGGDPLPYGFERNRPTVEALVRYATDQRILPADARADDMFVPIDA